MHSLQGTRVRASVAAVLVALAGLVALGGSTALGSRPAPLRVLSIQASGPDVKAIVDTSAGAHCRLSLRRGFQRLDLGDFAAGRSGRITITAAIKGRARPSVRGFCVQSKPARTPRGYRPPRANQDGAGAPQFTPVDAADGQGASLADVEGAVQWALAQQGRSDYNWWCLKFVANAYGSAAAGYNDPRQMAAALGLQHQPPTSAPRGSLMIFAAAQDNGNHGHVGISLGDGRMIDAESTVKITAVSGRYWGVRYVGWMAPPARWPGRPSTQAPTLQPQPQPQPTQPTQPPATTTTTTTTTTTPPPATTTQTTTVAPPPPPQHIYHVHNTCKDGACGLKVRNGPTLGNAQIGVLYDGNAANIRCQTLGTMVTGGEGSNDVWDQIDYNGGVGYVSDLYMDTPGDVHPASHTYFSSAIPRC